jgi:DNA-binding HxlR family transcriptional regulator
VHDQLSHEREKRRLQREVSSIVVERQRQQENPSLTDASLDNRGKSIIKACEHGAFGRSVEPSVSEEAYRAECVGYLAKWREERVLRADIA